MNKCACPKCIRVLKALEQMILEIEYIVEDKTLPKTALDHPSIIEARDAIKDLK